MHKILPPILKAKIKKDLPYFWASFILGHRVDKSHKKQLNPAQTQQTAWQNK